MKFHGNEIHYLISGVFSQFHHLAFFYLLNNRTYLIAGLWHCIFFECVRFSRFSIQLKYIYFLYWNFCPNKPTTKQSYPKSTKLNALEREILCNVTALTIRKKKHLVYYSPPPSSPQTVKPSLNYPPPLHPPFCRTPPLPLSSHVVNFNPFVPDSFFIVFRDIA